MAWQERAVVHELVQLHCDSEAKLDRALALLRELGMHGGVQSLTAVRGLVVAPIWPTRFLGRGAQVARQGRLPFATQEALTSIFGRIGYHEWPNVDHKLRSHAYAGVGVHARPWFDLVPAQVVQVATGPDPTAALGMLASHPSGQVREEAVKALASTGAGATLDRS